MAFAFAEVNARDALAADMPQLGRRGRRRWRALIGSRTTSSAETETAQRPHRWHGRAGAIKRITLALLLRGALAAWGVLAGAAGWCKDVDPAYKRVSMSLFWQRIAFQWGHA